jgi:hypothetical protein
MTTWKIAYTIQDGEHEYNDDFTCALETGSLDAEAVAALVAGRWCLDPDDRRQFLRELREDGMAFLPGDTRGIKELGWEPVRPIVVTISNGLVEAVTGVPEGMTLEVRDWDNAGLGADSGELLPAVRIWE